MLPEVRLMVDLTNCIWLAFVTFAKLSIAEKIDRDRPFRYQVSMFGGIARSHSITDEASKSHASRRVKMKDPGW
jgi:hypothetical protein